MVPEQDEWWYRNEQRSRRDGHGALRLVDHVVPVSKGGKSNLDNLQAVCAGCNLTKGNDASTPQAFKKRKKRGMKEVPQLPFA